MKSIVACTVILLVAVSRVSLAQICDASPSFEHAHAHIILNVGIDRQAQRYVGEGRYGRSGFFGAAQFGMNLWGQETFAGESSVLSLAAGWQVHNRPGARFGLCPVVSAMTMIGPSNIKGSLWEYRAETFSAGLRAGYRLTRSAWWGLTPAGAVTFWTSNPRMHTAYGGNLQSYPGGFCCGRRSSASLWLGFGVGFGPQMTFLPSVDIPLGPFGVTSYGLRATLQPNK